MSEVVALGYVVVSAADLESWSDFGQHALGLQLGSAPAGQADDAETLFFRVDERSWRLAVEKGEDGAIVALGFEVANTGDLDRLCETLDAAGFPAKEAPDIAALRRVSRVVQVSDPSGVPLEFFCGAQIDRRPFVSPTGARFVTGTQGVGHAVILVSDVEETKQFYLDVLGFRLTDVIVMGGLIDINFTSPNSRHHSLAFVSPPGAPGGHLEHIMLEVDDLDVVGRALDYCLDHDVPIRSMLGKHSNDYMISFYCQSPSPFAIEYGWGGRQIDAATHQFGRYDTANVWGHRPADGRDPEVEVAKMLASGRRPGPQ